MTIPELVHQVLQTIRRDFYQDRDREFFRDRNALTRAVSRWGMECSQRNWHFDADFMAAELKALLSKIKATGQPDYLPAYLHEAVSRSVGQRAEELRQRAFTNRLSNSIHKVTNGVTVVKAVVEKTPTELLASVYQVMNQKLKPQRQSGKQLRLL